MSKLLRPGYLPRRLTVRPVGPNVNRLDPQAEQRNPPHTSGNGVSAAKRGSRAATGMVVLWWQSKHETDSSPGLARVGHGSHLSNPPQSAPPWSAASGRGYPRRTIRLLLGIASEGVGGSGKHGRLNRTHGSLWVSVAEDLVPAALQKRIYRHLSHWKALPAGHRPGWQATVVSQDLPGNAPSHPAPR